MNALLAWGLVSSGLAVLVTRRVGVAVGALTAQSLLLVVLAARDADTVAGAIGAATLLARTLGLAVFLFWLGLHEHGRVRDDIPLAGRGALAFLVAVAWLVPALGLPADLALRTAVAMVAAGLLTATRPATLLQLLGIVLLDNGLVLAAGPGLVDTVWFEVGAAADLVNVATVALILHRRIVLTFGSGDTAALRSLRDDI